jgi:ADP-ribosylglycohydrolase
LKKHTTSQLYLSDLQKDKIKGVFFGQACGDALGLGTEFLSKELIKSYYPNGLTRYDQIISDNHRSRWKTGQWTDDTDQFLCICDSIIKNKLVHENHFAEELYRWYAGTPMGIGRTVLKVVSLPEFTKYPQRAAEIVWKMSKKRIASNGAIMRTSILGTWEFWDLKKVAANTERIAKVTHWDPRCVGSSVIITLIIANLLESGTLLNDNQIKNIAIQYDSRILPYIEKSKSNDIEELELDDPDNMGYTLKALSAGLWAFFNAKSFEEALLRVVNEGGDADTNASVAGSLLGAKFGYEAIPDYLISGLTGKSILEEKFNAYIAKL